MKNTKDIFTFTATYRSAHGKQPRGYGFWWFKINGESYSGSGRLPKARAEAIKKAYAKHPEEPIHCVSVEP